MSENTPATPNATAETEPLRLHQFDGIQEFDNPMPNWWLFLLYTSIVFAVVYWAYFHRYGPKVPDGQSVTRAIEKAQQEAARLAGKIDDPILWAMSREPNAVKAGKETYTGLCAACHHPELTGAIGPNLRDNIWIHGSQPMNLVKVITEGVQAKGMPTWGPNLGQKKISEVVAFILSHHTPPSF